MNIDMINSHGANRTNDMDIMTYGNPASSESRMRTEKMGFSLDITGKVRENAAYGKEELRSVEEVAQIAGMTDVSLQRDYMAVMSNSMSDEDFAELIKDGVNPAKIPAGEAVTNLDRIKIRMAEAGTTIAGFNDDISEDDIKAVLGNSINAGKIIADTLEASDLPASPENISSVKETVMMAENLKPLSDEAKAYMIGSSMAPTVDNLYKAEYSAAASSSASKGVHFDGAATYAGSEYTRSSWDDLKDQALDIIKEAGIEDEEAALDDAKWLAMHELPLTRDTLEAYNRLEDLVLPADPKDLIAAVTVAIEEGLPAKEADLTNNKSLYVRAAEMVDHFRTTEAPEDITRRRQLEEVRLVMTKEAGLTLLRKGINIETEPLEQLVEKLKEAEREFYSPLLTDDGKSYGETKTAPEELDNRIDLYKQTRTVVESIPSVPVRVLAEKVQTDELNLQSLAADGEVAKAAYEKAGEAYEALMTAPRADMGDSIRKAFRNVDDILSEIGMDINDSNRKAVRTLGYAGMMINRESVDSIRTATHSVERVINLMTPARTLSMIRQGYDPLREDIFDLEKKLSEETEDESQEKYSRFLLRLEHSGNISEDEKQTFIGMFRLFNTIEKQDGKVIGNVLSSGKELTLKNMLEASRNNRHMNGEYVIDDDFGFLENVVEKGESITSQLERTFSSLIDPKPDKDYISEKQREIRAAQKTGDAEEILSLISEPVTAENILAAGFLSNGMGSGYKKMFGGRSGSEAHLDGRDEDRLSEEDAKELINGFDDRESAMSAYERFLDRAEDVAKKAVHDSETYEDVRTYSMLYKQVGFAASLAKRESYEVPILLDDGWTSIHLTIEHTGDGPGKVRASFESEEFGKVDASFSVKTNGVDGFVVSDSRNGVDKLKNIDDKIREGFSADNMETSNLSFVFSKNPTSERYIPDTENTETSNRQLYRIAKAFIGAIQKA